MLPSAYRPAIGGVEELTRELALAYRAKGHDVAIYTNRWPRSLPAFEVLDDLPVHRLPFRINYPSLRGRLSFALTSRAVSRKLSKLLTEQQADVVHVQCISTNTLYALRAQRELGIPLIVTTQGELTMDASGGFGRPGALQDLLREAAARADVFTACSRKTLTDVEAFLGAPVEGARVVHNGASVEVFAEAARAHGDRNHVLAIGRLVPQKGFDVLLRAWARAQTTTRRLLVVGSGPEETRLRELVAELRIGESVEFFGSADREEVPTLFADALFVVVPSRSDEGLPLVALETMASGRALIVTESGGIREAADNGTEALIVPREDADALAAAISRLCADRELRDSLGAAALQRAAAFDWPVLADQYLDCFGTAVRFREGQAG